MTCNIDRAFDSSWAYMLLHLLIRVNKSRAELDHSSLASVTASTGNC